jgi:type III secretion protein V
VKPRAWRGAELALALLVVSVVAMMIVPLPTWLLDILIATNLAGAVTILLVVLYVPDALAIATFPTLLLLTTLYRLALTVSSARLILLQANAGEIIYAFGSFVVRGNYVVGAIVFLILTVIQLVVVARGSERVAEVAARFVLDAMPGKQMAIDADLRGGAIDAAEARHRRRELSRESQFYGAMDGAMKFVKGDVVATLFVIALCIVGGLVVGVWQHGMDATVALKRYGLLTIGDGLVTQIPALVLSVAAGVLVTRTASEEAGTPLGQEIARQVFGIPRVMGVAAGFSLLLAIVPGLPAAPFVVLAAALGVVAYRRSRTLAREDALAVADPASGRARPETPPGEAPFVPFVAPWGVELAADGRTAVAEVLAGLFDAREALFVELGVPTPAPAVRLNGGLLEGHARLHFFEIPSPAFAISANADEAARLVVEQATTLLRERASDFVGVAETRRLLDELEPLSPALVRSVVPTVIGLPVLAEVLRRLVEERVGIRDLRAILEALALPPPGERDAALLAEHVRARLKRPITFQLTKGRADLAVHLLDQTIEDTIRAALVSTPAGLILGLSPAASRDLLAAMRRAVTEAPPASVEEVVFLTQPDLRRFVRELLRVDLPRAKVVSFAELLPDVALRPLSKAHLAGIGDAR